MSQLQQKSQHQQSQHQQSQHQSQQQSQQQSQHQQQKQPPSAGGGNQYSKYTFFGPESEWGSDSFQLDSEIEEKIKEARRSKKVAFMSGCSRTYYPEKPGHSKFAKAFTAFGDPHIPPAKLYMPPESDRLNKPISTKGYGMGGLSGPRWAYDPRETQPGPGDYFKQGREEDKCKGKLRPFPPQVWMNYGLVKSSAEAKKLLKTPEFENRLTALWSKCQQVRVAFGSNLKQPRFGKEPKWNCVGPGQYVVRQWKQPKFLVNNAFNLGPIVFTPATKLHCDYGPKEHCIECDHTLMGAMDYYRTKFNINLDSYTDSSRKRVNSLGTQFSVKKTESAIASRLRLANVEEEEVASGRTKKKRFLLCRQCYCNTMRGDSKFWKSKKEVQRIFEKTRHCSFIHEHNELPEYIQKADCKLTRNLTRKEAILSLHWPDKCARRMVVKKNDRW